MPYLLILFILSLFACDTPARPDPVTPAPPPVESTPQATEGADELVRRVPGRALKPEACGELGGTCDASNSCVKLGTGDKGTIVLGTCETGTDDGGPIRGGGGPMGDAGLHCEDGINHVDYGRISFDCDAERERCYKACDEGAASPRERCHDACFNVNVNCCKGTDPTRQVCGGVLDSTNPGRRLQCQSRRQQCDAKCGTDPGKINGGTIPRSVQDCLADCRYEEQTCCTGQNTPNE